MILGNAGTRHQPQKNGDKGGEKVKMKMKMDQEEKIAKVVGI